MAEQFDGARVRLSASAAVTQGESAGPVNTGDSRYGVVTGVEAHGNFPFHLGTIKMMECPVDPAQDAAWRAIVGVERHRLFCIAERFPQSVQIHERAAQQAVKFRFRLFCSGSKN